MRLGPLNADLTEYPCRKNAASVKGLKVDPTARPAPGASCVA